MASVDTPRDQSISLTHTIGHDLGQPLCTLSTTHGAPRCPIQPAPAAPPRPGVFLTLPAKLAPSCGLSTGPHLLGCCSAAPLGMRTEGHGRSGIKDMVGPGWVPSFPGPLSWPPTRPQHPPPPQHTPPVWNQEPLTLQSCGLFNVSSLKFSHDWFLEPPEACPPGWCVSSPGGLHHQ